MGNHECMALQVLTEKRAWWLMGARQRNFSAPRLRGERDADWCVRIQAVVDWLTWHVTGMSITKLTFSAEKFLCRVPATDVAIVSENNY